MLPLFYLKSRMPLTRHKIRVRFCQRYRRTRPPKNKIAAVTHTAEILTRCSRTIATCRELRTETVPGSDSERWSQGHKARGQGQGQKK